MRVAAFDEYRIRGVAGPTAPVYEMSMLMPLIVEFLKTP
jgi:hypothetical protein